MAEQITAAARLVAGGPSAVRDVWLFHGLGSSGQGTFEGTGWLRALQPLADDADRPARLWLLELPGHRDHAEALADPASVTASAPWLGDAVRQLIAEHSAPLAAADEPWTRAAIGYSFGGRLVWEAADLLNRVVIGGLPRTEPDAETRSAVLAAAGQDPADSPALEQFLQSVTDHPFSGDVPPSAPCLMAYGEKDEIAADAPELAASVPGAQVLTLPGRTHMNAVSARAFKEAALALLA